QNIARGLQRALRGLRERNAIVGIAARLVKSADLRGEALRDRQASGVVFCAVDAQARGQPLQCGGQSALRGIQISLRIERRDVGVDGLRHFISTPSMYVDTKG